MIINNNSAEGGVSSVSKLKENRTKPGPEVIKLFSCSAQLSMKF